MPEVLFCITAAILPSDPQIRIIWRRKLITDFMDIFKPSTLDIFMAPVSEHKPPLPWEMTNEVWSDVNRLGCRGELCSPTAFWSPLAIYSAHWNAAHNHNREPRNCPEEVALYLYLYFTLMTDPLTRTQVAWRLLPSIYRGWQSAFAVPSVWRQLTRVSRSGSTGT